MKLTQLLRSQLCVTAFLAASAAMFVPPPEAYASRAAISIGSAAVSYPATPPRGAEAATPPEIPEVAATVNGQDITIAALKAQCLQAAGSSALQQLIDESLIDQAIQSSGTTITQAELNHKEAEFSSGLAGQSLDDALKQHDITEAMLESNIRYQLELNRLVTVAIQPARRMRHVWHIPIGMIYMDRMTGKLKSRTEAQALAIINGIRAKLKAGAAFSNLSMKYADQVSAKPSSGDLGILYDGSTYYSDLVPFARKLGKGEYSKQNFKSYAGYELIYVSSTAESHPKSEDASYIQAARDYRQQQIQDFSAQVLKSLRAKSSISIRADPLDPSGVAATVNGWNIPTRAVEARALETVGPSILRHLIASKVIDEAAKSENISVAQAEIDEKKAAILNRLNGQSLQAGLDKEGITLQQLESNLNDQIKLEKLSHAVAKPATHMRHVFHIAIISRDAGAGNTLPGGPQPITQDQALAKLQMIRNQLKAGAKFQDLAKQCSDDMFSKNSGGDLGILHDGTQVNRDILKVALTLKKGEYSSEPFKSFFGNELVYIESTEEDHPASEDSFYAQADNEYRDSQVDVSLQDVLQSLEDKAKVLIYFRQQ